MDNYGVNSVSILQKQTLEHGGLTGRIIESTLAYIHNITMHYKLLKPAF